MPITKKNLQQRAISCEKSERYGGETGGLAPKKPKLKKGFDKSAGRRVVYPSERGSGIAGVSKGAEVENTPKVKPRRLPGQVR